MTAAGGEEAIISLLLVVVVFLGLYPTPQPKVSTTIIRTITPHDKQQLLLQQLSVLPATTNDNVYY